jgi:c-di-GMP-binding flagellar brake protein YcgR
MIPPDAEPALSSTLPSSPQVQLLQTDEFSQYLLHSKGEMLPIFRRLAEHASQITMIFNEGRDIVLTSVMESGPSGLILEYGADAAMNRKALLASKLFCDTQLDKVKIQFIVSGLTSVDYKGRPAFRAALPESLLRLQRRESYRLVLPVLQRLKCKIHFPSVEGKDHVIEADVADISGGGVCLVGIPSSLPFELDMEFPKSHIELPEVGLVTATLRLRNIKEVTSHTGGRRQIIGCQFVGLLGPTETLIQRFIMKIERERKVRESGLG